MGACSSKKRRQGFKGMKHQMIGFSEGLATVTLLSQACYQDGQHLLNIDIKRTQSTNLTKESYLKNNHFLLFPPKPIYASASSAVYGNFGLRPATHDDWNLISCSNATSPTHGKGVVIRRPCRRTALIGGLMFERTTCRESPQIKLAPRTCLQVYVWVNTHNGLYGTQFATCGDEHPAFSNF